MTSNTIHMVVIRFCNYGLHFSPKKQLKFNMAKTESLLLPSPKITILQAFHINEQYQPVPQAKIHVTLILLALASYIYSFLLSPCPISIQFLLLPLSKTSLNLACYQKTSWLSTSSLKSSTQQIQYCFKMLSQYFLIWEDVTLRANVWRYLSCPN